MRAGVGATPPVRPAEPSPPPVIKLGASGPAVRDTQERLRRLFGDEPDVDGSFGDQTWRAVRRFQQQRGLPADGIVGPETWRALVEAGYGLGDRLLWHSRAPMRGDDVRELQHRLNQLGFDAGPEDGIFGPLTQGAVEEFQRNIGLPVDGTVGPATVSALRKLLRAHQSGGVGIRAREREALRRLSGRGLPGARILVDPAHGPGEPGATGPGGAGVLGPGGVTAGELSWAVASRVARRLAARGASVTLSRGPRTNPSGSERARLANELGVDAVVSIGFNGLATPIAEGASSYYYGSDRFVSEAGRRLAELVQEAVVTAGWQPDCRVHPMTWAILRETRMPAVVTEPAFLTSPVQEARLRNTAEQDVLAAAITRGVAAFFDASRTQPAEPVAAAS